MGPLKKKRMSIEYEPGELRTGLKIFNEPGAPIPVHIICEL